MSSASKPPCKYGATCYRTNAQHLAEFSHPPAATKTTQDSSMTQKSNGHDATTEPPAKKPRVDGESTTTTTTKVTGKTDSSSSSSSNPQQQQQPRIVRLSSIVSVTPTPRLTTASGSSAAPPRPSSPVKSTPMYATGVSDDEDTDCDTDKDLTPPKSVPKQLSASTAATAASPVRTGKPQLDLMRGDLLDAKEDLIVHQVNCVSKGTCHGLAKQLFTKFPQSDCYSRRAANGIPGTTEILGRVASLTGQFGSGDSKTAADSHEQREKWFKKALEDLASQGKAKGIKSVAMPWQIGCGIGGGNWDKYKALVEEFSASSGIKVKFYQKI